MLGNMEGKRDSRRVSRGILWAALPMLALVGCVQTSVADHSGIEVRKNVQYEDIPVPFKFEFDEDESWAYTKFEGLPLAVRSCTLYYHGDRPLVELRNWYEDQMPLHDWKLERTDNDSQVRMLFVKPGDTEEAEITLQRIVDEVEHKFVTKVTARIGVR